MNLVLRHFLVTIWGTEWTKCCSFIKFIGVCFVFLPRWLPQALPSLQILTHSDTKVTAACPV